MTDINFLVTIRDLLDINDVESAKVLLEGEIRYERIQEIKRRDTTLIYPFVDGELDELVESCFQDNPADYFTEWLVEFKAATKDAETIVVHPTTYTVLHVTGTDLTNIVIDPYWD